MDIPNRNSSRPPLEILLVEDNLADVRLAQEVLQGCAVDNRLAVVRDGEEALRYIRREGEWIWARRPDLILLDLNLPCKDGREVLAELKRDHHARRIPVIVLTTSRAESDIAASYDLHANCYLTKPVELDEFIAVMRSIETFWLMYATLPPHERE